MKGVFIWKAKKGYEAEFIKRWKADSEIYQTYPGAQGTKLHRSTEDPTLFLGYASWESFDKRSAASKDMKEKVVGSTTNEISETIFAGFFEDLDVIVEPKKLS